IAAFPVTMTVVSSSPTTQKLTLSCAGSILYSKGAPGAQLGSYQTTADVPVRIVAQVTVSNKPTGSMLPPGVVAFAATGTVTVTSVKTGAVVATWTTAPGTGSAAYLK